MRKRPDEPLAAHLTPCPSYAMSDRFRDWAVERMRGEVLGKVGAAGLDRMAVLKGKGAEAKAPPADAAAAGPAQSPRT
jgi:hypothetical protein